MTASNSEWVFNPVRELIAQKDQEYKDLLARFDALKKHVSEKTGNAEAIKAAIDVAVLGLAAETRWFSDEGWSWCPRCDIKWQSRNDRKHAPGECDWAMKRGLSHDLP